MISSLLALAITSLIGSAHPQFEKLLTHPQGKNEVKPIRQAKLKYSLVQRWYEKLPDGTTGQIEEKICEGDTTAPVVVLEGNDTIPASEWVNVNCMAEAKPGVKSKSEPARKVTVRMNFFVIFMDANLFVQPITTKNFVGFVGPDDVRSTTTGFVSFEDLTQKGVDLPIDSVAKYDDKYQLDGSTYIVSARFIDDAPPPIQ